MQSPDVSGDTSKQIAEWVAAFHLIGCCPHRARVVNLDDVTVERLMFLAARLCEHACSMPFPAYFVQDHPLG
jgi:hypothetical protein